MIFACTIVTFLMLLEVTAFTSNTSTNTSEETTMTTPESNSNNTREMMDCRSDNDCTGGDWYCELETKRCTCKLFHNGTACLPIVCQEDIDCQPQDNGTDKWYGAPINRCDDKGKCKCRMPLILSDNGSVCKDPVWTAFVGWSGLALAGIAVLVCCYCVIFRFNKKNSS